MTRTQIYLPEEILLEAKINARNNGINLSEFVRQAIKSYSKKVSSKSTKKTKLSILLKAVKPGVGDSDSAQKHNDIYKA